MMSVVMLIARRALRIIAIFSQVFFARVGALHGAQNARGARLHRADERVRKWPGCESIAATMSGAKIAGCEVVKRTRRMPGTSATASKSSAKLMCRGEGSR